MGCEVVIHTGSAYRGTNTLIFELNKTVLILEHGVREVLAISFSTVRLGGYFRGLYGRF